MAKILVVDDDRDILKMAERLLTHSKHQVHLASDAIQAMALLDQSEFDALISDANMPHFSGFQLVQTLKKQRRHQHMAIAMFTGLRDRKDIEKAMKAGVDDYILKPLDPLIFIQKVEALLEQKAPNQNDAASQFPTARPKAPALLQTDVEIAEISEVGLTLHTSFQPPRSLSLDIKASLFEEIDAEPPPIKILNSEQIGDEVWKSEAIFLGAPESFLQKIRAYVLFPGRMKKAS